MNYFKSTMIAAAVLAVSLGNASAQGRYEVLIDNWSEVEIASVQMSPTADDCWGDDLLGAYIVDGLGEAIVEPTVQQGCVYDIRVTFVDGRVLMLDEFNLCATAAIRVGPFGLETINA